MPGAPRRKQKGPPSAASGPELSWINDQMRSYVADAAADGPLCFEKFGKARRKTVRSPSQQQSPRPEAARFEALLRSPAVPCDVLLRAPKRHYILDAGPAPVSRICAGSAAIFPRLACPVLLIP